MRQRPDFKEPTASIKLIAYLASIHSSKLRPTLTSSTENLARVRLRLLMPGTTQMRQDEAFVAIDIHRPAEVTVVELSVLLPTVVIGRHRRTSKVDSTLQRQVLPGPGTQGSALRKSPLGSRAQPVGVAPHRYAILRPCIALVRQLCQRRSRSFLGCFKQPLGVRFGRHGDPRHLLCIDIASESFGKRQELRVLEHDAVLESRSPDTTQRRRLQMRLVLLVSAAPAADTRRPNLVRQQSTRGL